MTQMTQDQDQLWLGAYLGAMAMIVLGETIAHRDGAEPGTIDGMDGSAREIADRVVKTAKEREVQGQIRRKNQP